MYVYDDYLWISMDVRFLRVYFVRMYVFMQIYVFVPMYVAFWNSARNRLEKSAGPLTQLGAAALQKASLCCSAENSRTAVL